MKALFLLIAIFSVVAIKAQTLKTFSGTDGGGNVTYSYYFDEEGKEIKHGIYKYVEKDSHINPVGNYSNTVSGTFKNGKKNGIWTNNIIANDYGTNRYETYTIIQKHIYKDGIPDGQWTYSNSGKYRTKEYSRNGWVWSLFTPLNTSSAQINWKDSVLVGNFKIETTFDNISGQLNNDGYLIGHWKIGNDESYYTNDGILKEITNRSPYGNSFHKDYTKEIELFRQYRVLPIEEQQDFLFKNRLIIDTVKTLKSYIQVFDKRIFRTSYTENDIFDATNLIGYGRYIEVKFIEQISLDRFISKYNIHFDYYRLENEIDFINEHLIELSDEDIELLLQKIEEVDLQEQERQNEIRLKKEANKQNEQEARIAKEKAIISREYKKKAFDKFSEIYNSLSYNKRIKEYYNIPSYLEEYSDKFISNDISDISLEIRCFILSDIFRNNNIFSYQSYTSIKSYYSLYLKEYKIYKKRFSNQEQKIIEDAANEFKISL